MKILYGAFLVLTVLLLYPAIAAAEGRVIRKEVTVSASLEEVWKAWTTTEGATTFFGPAAHIEATLGGPYELYFAPTLPYGQRGSEGCKIHSFVPMQQLAFQWNAPPDQPEIRRLNTLVFVQFEELGVNQVRVSLANIGYGEGGEWDKAYAYFDQAWGKVLANLRRRFTTGPIDWGTFSWQSQE